MKSKQSSQYRYSEGRHSYPASTRPSSYHHDINVPQDPYDRGYNESSRPKNEASSTPYANSAHPLSPLSIPSCVNGPVLQSPDNTDAACSGSSRRENRPPSDDGYDMKGVGYGYHPNHSSKPYDDHNDHPSKMYDAGHYCNGRSNTRDRGYNNNQGQYNQVSIPKRHYEEDDNETSGHVPSQVAVYPHDPPRKDRYHDTPPPPPPPPPSSERRDDYSGSSTIPTIQTKAPSPQRQLQRQSPRNNDHHRDYRDGPAHSSDKSSRLSIEIPVSPQVPTSKGSNNSNSRPPMHSSSSNGQASSDNNRRSGGHHSQHQLNQSRSTHHHSNTTHTNSNSNPQQPYPKSPRIILAENERRQSQARHQILKEISQATNMKQSALDDKDRKFWARQIATLNESFKKL